MSEAAVLTLQVRLAKRECASVAIVADQPARAAGKPQVVELSRDDELSSDWSPDLSEDEAGDYVCTAGAELPTWPLSTACQKGEGGRTEVRMAHDSAKLEPAGKEEAGGQEQGRNMPSSPSFSGQPPGGRDTPYSPKAARGGFRCRGTRMLALTTCLADRVRLLCSSPRWPPPVLQNLTGGAVAVACSAHALSGNRGRPIRAR